MDNQPIANNNKRNIEMLTKAGVPAFTFKTSLRREGMGNLAHVTANGEFQNADKTKNSYFFNTNLAGPSGGAKATCLFAKELVLAGAQVRVLSYQTLAALVANLFTEEDPSRPVPRLPPLGRSGPFLVLPDYMEYGEEEVSMELRTREASTVSWLCQYHASGGALVLHGGVNRHNSMRSNHPYFDSILGSFVEFRIGGADV